MLTGIFDRVVGSVELIPGPDGANIPSDFGPLRKNIKRLVMYPHLVHNLKSATQFGFNIHGDVIGAKRAQLGVTRLVDQLDSNPTKIRGFRIEFRLVGFVTALDAQQAVHDAKLLDPVRIYQRLRLQSLDLRIPMFRVPVHVYLTHVMQLIERLIPKIRGRHGDPLTTEMKCMFADLFSAFGMDKRWTNGVKVTRPKLELTNASCKVWELPFFWVPPDPLREARRNVRVSGDPGAPGTEVESTGGGRDGGGASGSNLGDGRVARWSGGASAGGSAFGSGAGGSTLRSYLTDQTPRQQPNLQLEVNVGREKRLMHDMVRWRSGGGEVTETLTRTRPGCNGGGWPGLKGHSRSNAIECIWATYGVKWREKVLLIK